MIVDFARCAVDNDVEANCVEMMVESSAKIQLIMTEEDDSKKVQEIKYVAPSKTTVEFKTPSDLMEHTSKSYF